MSGSASIARTHRPPGHGPSYALLISSSAARDVAEAHAYHARHGKAEAFIASVDRAFDQIAERPLMYPIVYESVRRVYTDAFLTPSSLVRSRLGDDSQVQRMTYAR
jgi:hypothetical protein